MLTFLCLAAISTSHMLFALFHPLGAPYGRFEGFGKVLRFMDDFAILKLHNADRPDNRGQIIDHVLGYPQIVNAHNAADQEAAWFSRMVATQSLEVVATKDLLARLRIFAEDITDLDLVFCFQISGCRCRPVLVQGNAVILSLHVHS